MVTFFIGMWYHSYSVLKTSPSGTVNWLIGQFVNWLNGPLDSAALLQELVDLLICKASLPEYMRPAPGSGILFQLMML